ncbi:hypothetical protein T05_389 [Trichinella murrelli]|uniref:Uncharacterized protein n=2 Tax=Trichinella TaxID=6333 RepID=A0A0V0TKY5_9BILA|nr:hypothetical protein T05_389 [Trichinella murrelli]
MQIFIRVLCIGLRGVNCNGCCRTLCGMTNEAKQKKLKNTDNMQQIMNGTKQNKRRQQKSENADHTRQIEDDKKQIEDDTKQIEDDTKQNKRRQSSWDPNSVGLGLGYFERVKLSHSLKNGAKKMGKRGRHEADRGRHEADRGRHEADRGRHEADRGRHEADRGPHEADRGPHEAEQEKTKFLGPQFCRSGIGILRKGEDRHNAALSSVRVQWSKENVKTRTARSRTREGNSVRLELIPRPENFPINSNRFLALQYANEDRLKIALSSISNGALI